MLRAKETLGHLAADLADPINGPDEGYALTSTGAPEIGACGRTIFVFERVDDDRDVAAAMARARGVARDVVCFGQKVRLRLNNYYSRKNVSQPHNRSALPALASHEHHLLLAQEPQPRGLGLRDGQLRHRVGGRDRRPQNPLRVTRQARPRQHRDCAETLLDQPAPCRLQAPHQVSPLS